MKKEEIHLGDLERIMLGQAPGEFMLEVLLRTLIMYVALLIVFRLLGKRMNAQLSITEMSIMVTLGAIVSVPMQLPDRGLIPPLAVLVTALVLQRGLNYWAVRQRSVEVALQDDASLVVSEGVLQTKELTKLGVSHEQLFAQLRSNDVLHLGQVKRVYLEGCGRFSIFKNAQPKPGLSVLPLEDRKIHGDEPHAEGQRACLNCATVVEDWAAQQPCPTCGRQKWTYAVAGTHEVAEV